MVIDKKGNLFEDRRKEKEDRRKNTVDIKGGRREKIRRENDNKGSIDPK